MENATKALLIAASVLIVIVIIAAGIKILDSMSGVVDEVDKVSGAMGAAVFNSQFKNYEGTQKGTQVRDFLEKVMATYRDGSSRQIKVNGFFATFDSIEKIKNDLLPKIQTNQNYTIELTYTDGYVTSCNIEKIDS